jgi:hypothetical protein
MPLSKNLSNRRKHALARWQFAFFAARYYTPSRWMFGTGIRLERGAEAMANDRWEILIEISGELEAELLRGLLEAQGIPAILNQESAGRAYGLGVGPLGVVQILVPETALANARQILDDYYAGEFEGESLDFDEDFEE